MRFRHFYGDLTIRRMPGSPATPTVSIVLPTFARAHGPLGRSIASVIEQSYGDFELIVVDDGSRDGTEDVLADLQRTDARIVVHRFEKNCGLPALRVNQGILAAKGRYIAYQFDDDVWTRDSLKSRVEVLEASATPGIVYGNALAEVQWPDGSITERMFGGEFNFGLLYNQNYIANNSILHHACLLDTVGLLDPHVLTRRYSDHDLWLRLGRICRFQYLDEHVSTVSVNEAGSLGNSVDIWLDRYRKYLEIDRNGSLQKHAIAEFDVCGVDHLRGQFEQEEIDSACRDEIAPFIARNNDYWPDEEIADSMHTRRKMRRLLVTKPDYSTSIDVTIRNFTSQPNFPIRHYFVREFDAVSANLNRADTVLLYRTVLPRTTQLLRKHGKETSFVYLMDDNMLRISEVGEPHGSLAPGTVAYGEIQNQIREAHACIGYSNSIVSDMKALNPRVFRLDTNIPRRFVRPREYRRSVRLQIAILSGIGRRDILASLWPALEAFAAEDPDALEVHVWGIDPSEFGTLPCSLSWRPFTHAYDLYRNALLEEAFDIVLVPLDASTMAAQGKSPVKLLEAVVCGAICIFTDAPPYAALPNDICIKADNAIPAWIAALKKARDLGAAGRAGMLERAREFVIERYSTEGQIDDFLASFDAADLHRRLRGRRIAYVFHEAPLGGATLHLLIHAGLARSCGVEVLGIIPAGTTLKGSFLKRWRAVVGNSPLIEGEWKSGYVNTGLAYEQRPIGGEDRRDGEQLAQQMRAYDVGLVHAATWIPAATCAARSLDVPCVFSVHRFYATPPGALEYFADAIHCSSLKYARSWSEHGKAPARRMVCPVGPTFFAMYDRRAVACRAAERRKRIVVSGTIQRRKNQLAAIEAVVLLLERGFDIELHLLGYDHFDDLYRQECRDAAERIGSRVLFHGFVEDPARFYDLDHDILLIAATEESMPQTMLQAMAAGLLVVATDVGGVTELIKHRYSGIIAASASADDLANSLQSALTLPDDKRRQMIRHAHRTISLIGKPSYIRAELVDLYNQAFEVASLRVSTRADRPAMRAEEQTRMVPELQRAHGCHLSGAPADGSGLGIASTAFATTTPSGIQFDLELSADVTGEEHPQSHVTLDIHAATVAGRRLDFVLSAEGGGDRTIRLTIAAAVRPDLILRSGNVNMPADGAPRRVRCRFEPLALIGRTRLRVDLSVDRGAIRLYVAKGKKGAPMIELFA